MNVIQWKRLLLSPKKAMRRLRSRHCASAHETSPVATGAPARAAAASWAPATAATAAKSVRRLIRLVGPPRAIILSIRAALAGVARPRIQCR